MTKAIQHAGKVLHAPVCQRHRHVGELHGIERRTSAPIA
jgi:hypothetical protein